MKGSAMRLCLILALLLIPIPAWAQGKAFAATGLTAAQMLGQQLGACAASQAELVQKLTEVQAELERVTKERDEAKAGKPTASPPAPAK